MFEKNDTLGDLWEEARDYGRVSMFTFDDGGYHASIKFHSIQHTELKAESGNGHETPHEALAKAIGVAKEIVGEMEGFTSKFKLLRKG